MDLIAQKTALTKKDIEAVLSAFQTTVHEEVLTKGNEIRLRDLGTFKQKVIVFYVQNNVCCRFIH